MKEILIYSDQKKFDVLIAERQKFAQQLNEGIELLKGLPFVEPEQCPTLEELKKPVDWWNDRILEAIQPKKVKGFTPNPRQQAIGYSVDYDKHIQDIHRFPWSAIELLEYDNGTFHVSEAVEENVRKQSSTYGTQKQAKVFSDLEKMLESLNAFCDSFVSLKADLNAIAASIHCKVIQLEDRSHKIVPDYRRLFLIMERGSANN